MALAAEALFVQHPKCGKCGKAIREPCIFAGERHYHVACMACDRCKEKIDAEFRIDEKSTKGEKRYVPYCVKCFEEQFLPQCVACKKRIQVKTYVTSCNAVFHTECHRCEKCKKFIEAKDQPMLVNDKLYCQLHVPNR